MDQEKRDFLIGEQLKYAAFDTVCFFAPYPEKLVERQREKWMPLIERMNGFGCRYTATQTVRAMPLAPETLSFLNKTLNGLDDDALVAFCEISGACKSVILATAVLKGFLPAGQAFDLSCLEEDFENEFWTTDSDAAIARDNRKQAVVAAAEKLKGK